MDLVVFRQQDKWVHHYQQLFILVIKITYKWYSSSRRQSGGGVRDLPLLSVNELVDPPVCFQFIWLPSVLEINLTLSPSGVCLDIGLYMYELSQFPMLIIWRICQNIKKSQIDHLGAPSITAYHHTRHRAAGISNISCPSINNQSNNIQAQFFIDDEWWSIHNISFRADSHN